MTPRAVRAGIAVVIVTVAVNAMGTKGINPGTLVATRASNRTETTTPPATATPKMSTSPSIPAPPYPVEHETVSLADPTRDTPAGGDVPARGGRALVTVVRRPTGLPGPLPLVVFAHGWNVNPT